MPRGRAELVAAVRQDLATARGTARAVLAAAESARAEAHRRREVVRQAYGTCLGQLAQARDAARLDILRRFHRESSSLSGHVESLAAACASGAASSAWRTWSPTEPERGRHPGLLRIGMVAYDPPPPPGQALPTRRTVLPALVPLLDQAHLHLAGDPDTVTGVVAGLLLRALGSTRPGDLRLSLADPIPGSPLDGFTPLADAGLLDVVDGDGLTALLAGLVAHIARIRSTVLGDGYTSVAELAAAGTGRRPEPWRIAVLAGQLTGPTDPQRALLDEIVRTGPPCGVHLVSLGLPLPAHPSVERVTVRGQTATCDTTGDLPVRLDPPPPAARVVGFCRSMAERLQVAPAPTRLSDLEPEKLWTGSATHALVAPLGDSPDGGLVEVLLGDDPPHALVGGPPGSGKTNLVYAWLGALATRYGPDELELYLLDFNPGDAFARFAPTPADTGWLPQVRLVGMNLHDDREFGLAVLRQLGEQLRHRVRTAQRYGVGTLADLRAEDPGGGWPRIVAVLDEFDVLVCGRDAVATEAVARLEELACRGRSLGIHLLLSTTELRGAEALGGRSLLASQLTLRIALPKATRVLAEHNLAAQLIPRGHAVVNADSGSARGNRVVRLPDAGDRDVWRALQRKLWHARPDGVAPPRVFDGAVVPVLPRPAPVGGADPVALLGETMNVHRRPATLTLGRAGGRNLAVLGGRTAEACDILAAAALSLAEQQPGRFSIACFDDSAQPAARALLAALPRARWFDTGTAAELLAELADNLRTPTVAGPHYVIGYGWDALAPAGGSDAGTVGTAERLRAVLSGGPARRVHLLGWWRSVAGLCSALGGTGARTDPIGAWVALDVPGRDLAPLWPLPGGPAWSPRPRRALFFDRSVHRAAEVIIPYEVKL